MGGRAVVGAVTREGLTPVNMQRNVRPRGVPLAGPVLQRRRLAQARGAGRRGRICRVQSGEGGDRALARRLEVEQLFAGGE